MNKYNNEPFMISDIMNTVEKVSENISPYTINYNKNLIKLQKMKEIYKTDANKFSKKYLIKDFNE